MNWLKSTKPWQAIGISILLTFVLAQAQTIKQDPIFPDTWNVYENGRQVGEIRPDPIFPDKFNVYDEDGRRQGTWKRDPIKDEEWQYFEE